MHNGSPSTDGDRTNTLSLTAVEAALSLFAAPSFAALYFEQVLAKSPKIMRTYPAAGTPTGKISFVQKGSTSMFMNTRVSMTALA